MPIDSSQLENDRFGYSCYTLVVPMPSELTARLDRIERAAGQKRAKIPAHITVKGTIYGIDSLDSLIAKASAVVSHHRAFVLELNDAELRWSDERGSGFLFVPVTPPLQALHDDLVKAIAPLGKPAYQDDPYGAHLTLVQEVDAVGLAEAKNLASALDWGSSIEVEFVDVISVFAAYVCNTNSARPHPIVSGNLF